MAKSKRRNGNPFYKGDASKWIDLYDIHALDDGELFTFGNTGSVGKILRYTPVLDCELDNQKNLEIIGMTVSKFIQEIADPSVTIAFHFLRTKEVQLPDKMAKDRVPTLKDGTREEIPEILNEREKMLRLLVDAGEILENHYYISIKIDFNKENLSLWQKAKMTFDHVKSFFGQEVDGDLERVSFELEKRVNKLTSIVKSLKSSLSSAGVKIEEIESNDGYLQTLAHYLRPDSGLAVPVSMENASDDESVVNRLMAGNYVEDYPNHLVIDNYIYQLYELEKINPYKDFDFDMIRHFQKYPMEFAYTIMFSGLNKVTATQSIKKAIKSMDREISMTTNSKGEAEDLELVDRRDLAYAMNDEVLRSGKGAVEYSVTFLAKLPLKKVEHVMYEKRFKTYNQFLYDFEKSLKSDLFWSFGDSEWGVLRYGQWSGLCKTLPGVCSINTSFLKTFIERPESVTLLLPLSTEVDKEAPHLGFNHFFTPSRNIFPFEVLTKMLDSWVTVIMGDMGKGKTVVLNILTIFSYFSLLISGKKPLIRIIDNAGIESSFFKLVKGVNGTVISFINSEPPSIQLLEIDPFRSIPTRRKKDSLAEYIKSIRPDMTEKEINTKLTIFYRRATNGSGTRVLSHKERHKLALEVFGVSEIDYERFSLKPGECAPTPGEMVKIMNVFELMLSKDAVNPEAFSIFPAQEVEDLISETYNVTTDRMPSISDVYNLLRDKLAKNPSKDPRPYQLLKMIRRWTVDEGVNPSFDLPTNINLEDDCIMFDTFGLSDDPIVEAIYNILIYRLIERDMYTRDDRVRIVSMDEGWKTAGSPPAQRALKAFTRLSRKYGFMFLLSSQMPEDFFRVSRDLGESIIGQATSFIFCGSSKQFVIDQIRNHLNLSESYLQLIPQLGIKENNTETRDLYKTFARLMIYRRTKNQKDRYHVLDSILSPIEFEFLNSNKEDNAITNFYMRHREMSIIEVCRHMMKGGHIGDNELLEYLAEGNHIEAIKKCLPPEISFDEFIEGRN